MTDPERRTVLQQALRGTALVVVLGATVIATAAAIAGVFVVVMG